MEEQRGRILQHLIDTGLVDRCIQYQTRDCTNPYWREELRSELWLWLCEYDITKLQSAADGNHLNALISAWIKRQWRSKTSPFYKKYKKVSNLMQELTKKEENIPDILK